MSKTLCILVLYKPAPLILNKAIESIINQVDLTWISDNTPNGYSGIDDIKVTYSDRVLYNLMNGNVGIAKAQNEGIKYAIDNNFDFIFFLDQDSISPACIVEELKEGFSTIEKRGIRVGGVGPQPINRATGKKYKMDTLGKTVEGLVETKSLMNSASLLRVDLFREVGLMDECLFIDGVDYELCWRAASRAQYCFYIMPTISLSHQLGEGDRSFMGAPIKISTPFRAYYQFRNYFILLRRNYVPAKWKFKNGIKYLCKYFYFPIFCKPRIEYLKNINRGIYDGINNK